MMTLVWRLRRRIRLERLFWVRWTPLYLRCMARELSVWRAARYWGPMGVVAWVSTVVRAMVGRRREIIVTVHAVPEFIAKKRKDTSSEVSL
jgi:hypothetical protein